MGILDFMKKSPKQPTNIPPADAGGSVVASTGVQTQETQTVVGGGSMSGGMGGNSGMGGTQSAPAAYETVGTAQVAPTPPPVVAPAPMVAPPAEPAPVVAAEQSPDPMTATPPPLSPSDPAAPASMPADPSVDASANPATPTDGTAVADGTVAPDGANPAAGAPPDQAGTPQTPPTTADASANPAAPGAPNAQPGQPAQAGTPSAPGTQPQAGPKSASDKKHEELDLMTHLTQRSNRVFMLAQGKAKEFKNQFIDSEHLLFGLLSDSEIYKILTELKVQPKLIEGELAKIYKKEAATTPPQFSPRVKRIIDLSLVVARQLGYEFISPEHILVSLVDEGEGAGAQVLKKLGLKKEDLNKKVTGKKSKPGEEEDKQHKSALAEFTVDLTEKAAKGLLDPVVERSDVIERVIHILSRRTKNNPALTGEAGVGKTAIAEGLAQRIVAHQVPEPLLNKQILQLDLMSILAGASHRGEFEQRMKNLVEEVQGAKGQIILFIDELHNIVGAGSSGEGSMDASNFLKPALARGEIQLIGATTLTEYRKYIEKDPALERRFQPVLVPEPTEEAATKMLMAIKGKYEAFHRVKISDEVVEDAVKLSKRYVGDRFLPDKAVDLIDEAASAVRLPLISLPEEIQSLETRLKQVTQERDEAKTAQDSVREHILNNKVDDIQADLSVKQEEYNLKKGQTTTEVTPEIIKDIVSRWTGVPVSKISESEVEKLSKLEDIIHERMIDQEEAVGVVAQAVRRGRAGLKSTQRPIGSFVFLGPTGVGKTELAKTLAEILFGKEEAMIRLDMTEYMEKHEVAKLLGAPPGYVGYEEGGKLTEAVRRKPYSVVLFDEIEKAHPDIFNILLQILDDGRLTDNKGHVISFKNTVVICTSNIGTKTIQQDLINNKNAATDKKLFNSIKEKVMAELMKFFRPELVNRFDEVTVFKPLSFEDVMKIVKLQLKALKKLLEDQQMSMVYTDAALEEISRQGYDPVFGARPLRRTIQKVIENPISTLIIKGTMKQGDIVRIDFVGEDFVFDVGKGRLFEDDQAKKWFMCETTNKTFKTIVKDTATVISPYNGSAKVRELNKAETEAEEDKERKAADNRRKEDSGERAEGEEKKDGDKKNAKEGDDANKDGENGATGGEQLASDAENKTQQEQQPANGDGVAGTDAPQTSDPAKPNETGESQDGAPQKVDNSMLNGQAPVENGTPNVDEQNPATSGMVDPSTQRAQTEAEVKGMFGSTDTDPANPDTSGGAQTPKEPTAPTKGGAELSLNGSAVTNGQAGMGAGVGAQVVVN